MSTAAIFVAWLIRQPTMQVLRGATLDWFRTCGVVTEWHAVCMSEFLSRRILCVLFCNVCFIYCNVCIMPFVRLTMRWTELLTGTRNTRERICKQRTLHRTSLAATMRFYSSRIAASERSVCAVDFSFFFPPATFLCFLSWYYIYSIYYFIWF